LRLRTISGDVSPNSILKAQRPKWLGRLSEGINKTTSGLGELGRFLEKKPDFSGMWTCVHTWGLEDFLRSCGASEWQILCASHAPWPCWEFTQTSIHPVMAVDEHFIPYPVSIFSRQTSIPSPPQKGDQFVYINHNSLCSLREEFEVDGPEYIAYDTRRKELRSKAYWEFAQTGTDPVMAVDEHFIPYPISTFTQTSIHSPPQTLVIDRHSEDGHFRERRHLNSDGQLIFTLLALKPGMEGCSWGRTFERKLV
jgi:hypothetical protein